MTSKISYFKMWLEELRHQTAYIVVTIFVFLMELISFLMSLQNTLVLQGEQEGSATTVTTIQASLVKLSQPSIMLGIMASGLAVYGAFSILKFLHSKKQMDYYGALPVTRGRLFCVATGVQGSIFLTLMSVQILLKGMLLLFSGYASGKMFLQLCYSWICAIAIYGCVWAVAALSMILTGHTFVAMMGFFVFCGYVPVVLRCLVPTYEAVFYDTFVSSEQNQNFWNMGSPATIVIQMVRSWSVWKWDSHLLWIICAVVMAIVVWTISYWLFQKRPAEAAGRAMAFPKMQPVLRFILVIPIALYSGVYLSMMSFQESLIWLLIGVVLGSIIFHGIVEWVYEFNIKAIFQHKMDMAVTIACCLLFVLYFWMDLSGYDTYLPEKNEIASMEIFTSRVGQEYSYEEREEMPEMSSWMVGQLHQFAAQVIEAAEEEKSPSMVHDYIDITYILKDGRRVQRSYTVSTGFDYGIYANCYDKYTYKEYIYSIYQYDQVDMEYINLYDSELQDYVTYVLNKKYEEEFLRIYKSELSHLTYEEACQESPIGDFGFRTPNNIWQRYDIWPSFEATVRFVEQYGVNENLLTDTYIQGED